MVPYELKEGLRWESMILEVSLVLLSKTCIMVAIEWIYYGTVSVTAAVLTIRSDELTEELSSKP